MALEKHPLKFLYAFPYPDWFRRTVRRAGPVLGLMMLLAATTGVARSLQTPPAAEPDWKTVLFEQASSAPAEAYARAHPEEAFAIFREGGPTAKPGDRASLLWMLARAGNPHTLEVVDIAMNDVDDGMQSVAVTLLKSIAFQEFPRKNAPSDYKHRFAGLLNDGGKAYAAWRNQITGKTPEEAIVMAEQNLLRTIAETSSPEERDRCVYRLIQADFRSDTPFGRLRLKIANEAHILPLLERIASPPNAPTTNLMYAFELFQADEDCLRRVVLPVAGKGNNSYLRSTAIRTLSARRSPMGTEIITRLLTKGMDGDPENILHSPISASSDPALIPIYIGVLEANPDSLLAGELEYALSKMTHNFSEASKGITAWERWWKQNRDQFPEAVRNISIPRLKPHPQKDVLGKSYPRRLVWREVGNDRRRGYWLACPLRQAEDRDKKPIAEEARGLIVALPEDGDADKSAAYWLDACGKAFSDRFFIAIPDAPRLHASRTVAWETAKSLPQNAGSPLTAAHFMADLVEDVSAEFGIERSRCFLFGSGASGIPVYDCALAEKTPFRGFYLLNAKFQSSLLPPLERAKGRRFYVQSSPSDKSIPAWQTTAACTVLSRRGAEVKQVSVPGGHGYTFDADPWQPLRDAVAWMEAGPGSAKK